MSRMSTACPNCLLHLAVTPADLRIGQGYVRCGRCQRVFNALISLTEDPEQTPQEGAQATGTGSMPVIDEAPASAEPDAGSGDEPADEATLAALRAVPDDVDVVESVGTGTFETIILEGHGVLQTEEHVTEERLDQELQNFADRLEAGQDESGENVLLEFSEPLELGEAPPPEPRARVAHPEYAEPAPQPEDFVEDLEVTQRTHWGWKLGAALLGLLLLAQVVHHFRRPLLAQSWSGPALGALYGAMGRPMEPDWDLLAYDVRQLGAEAPSWAADRILVRASVLNRARHGQPPPVLRVTLQDRYGNALATHDVLPQDYLRAAPPARLAPDQRVDAELVLADPAGKAAGFELDACLPGADDHLHCAGAR